jgi:hypothetical protein
MPANRSETALNELQRDILIAERQRAAWDERISILKAAAELYKGGRTDVLRATSDDEDGGRARKGNTLAKGAVANYVKTFVLGRADEEVKTKEVNEYVAKQTGRPPSETRNAVHMALTRYKQKHPDLKWTRE